MITDKATLLDFRGRFVGVSVVAEGKFGNFAQVEVLPDHVFTLVNPDNLQVPTFRVGLGTECHFSGFTIGHRLGKYVFLPVVDRGG